MLRSVVVVSILATAACHSSSTAHSTTGPSNKAEPANAAGADDVLGFLPIDSEIVIGFDANAMRSSALWKQFEPQIVAGLGNKLPMMRDACGFDPLTSVERVAIGGKLTSDEKFEGVFVMRGVSGAKTLDCIAKETAKDAKVTNEKGTLTVQDGNNEKMVATIVGSTTLVVQMGAGATPATLEAVVRSGAPLRGSKAFMALFDRREANPSVWGMINGSSSLLTQMAQAGAKPKSVDGTLVLSDRFVGAARIKYATPGEADQVKQQIAQIAAMANGKVDKIDLAVNGDVLRIDVVATDAQVRAILGMFGFM